MEIDAREFFAALGASLIALSGLVVWVVKHIVRGSDHNLDRLIDLLEQSVRQFTHSMNEAEGNHNKLITNQLNMISSQSTVVKELERLAQAIDRLAHMMPKSRDHSQE